MLACPKAEVILVLLDKREIFRSALLKRLRGVAEPYPWPTSARSAWVIAACRGSSLLLSRNRLLLSSRGIAARHQSCSRYRLSREKASSGSKGILWENCASS